ncbi:hypothetical protein EC973_007055 [Apophysomyces ossiformis]|uniref:Threonine/serine exporter-like N-terminal domain-containing protein n=1 Tax=Apophysomyces ossiformis TaxID=679940 RepID=A0A8H7BGH7_9FUNG|nr:hypothetical protein EC973_007055 [Apophysomyces ossiformis]
MLMDPQQSQISLPSALKATQENKGRRNARSRSMFEWQSNPSSSTCCIDLSLQPSLSSNNLSDDSETHTLKGPVNEKNELYEHRLFLLRLCKSLVACGAPAHRLDHCVQCIRKKLTISADFGYFSGFLVVSFGDPESLATSVQLIKVDSGLDLYRLTRVYEVFQSVMCDEIDVQDASAALVPILHDKPFYAPWITLVAHAIASSASIPLFFFGTALDMLIGLGLGLIVALGTIHVSRRVTRFSSIFDVLLSAVVGFLSAIVSARLPSSSTCFYALSVGGVVNLLPGYATLISLLEISAGSVATGTLRLTTTLVYSLLIGFGLALGASIHELLFPSLALIPSSAACENKLPVSFHILLVPIFAAANIVLQNGHPSKYPIMLGLAILSRAVHYISLQKFVAYPHVATVLAAFAVAIASNIYARLKATIGFVDMITGLLFLVPGSVGVASSLNTFGQALSSSSPTTEVSVILNAGQQGIIFAAHMMVIAVSVSVGLVLAAVVIYPVRKLTGRRGGAVYRYKKKDWVGEITF